MSEPYQTEKSWLKIRVCLSQISGPEGVAPSLILRPAPFFLSIKAYPEKYPTVIVVRKVIRRNGRLERYLGIYELPEVD
jgi:hypothetical protein